MKQLSVEYAEIYPKPSQVVLNDFYMDDFLTGCDTLNDAILLADEKSNSGFHLQKWSSNSNAILNHVKAVNPTAVLKLGEN